MKATSAEAIIKYLTPPPPTPVVEVDDAETDPKAAIAVALVLGVVGAYYYSTGDLSAMTDLSSSL